MLAHTALHDMGACLEFQNYRRSVVALGGLGMLFILVCCFLCIDNPIKHKILNSKHFIYALLCIRHLISVHDS